MNICRISLVSYRAYHHRASVERRRRFYVNALDRYRFRLKRTVLKVALTSYPTHTSSINYVSWKALTILSNTFLCSRVQKSCGCKTEYGSRYVTILDGSFIPVFKYHGIIYMEVSLSKDTFINMISDTNDVVNIY
jgi:hypothetical protein